jgi:hypothetical protein
MKSALREQTLKCFGFVIISVSAVAGMAAHAAGSNDAALAAAHRPGQPFTKSGEWKDPDKVLPELDYDNLRITVVAEDLRRRFEGGFDVLLPIGAQSAGFEWNATPIHLRLKEVTAGEVFNAMNLLFEASKIPLRWELTMNGRRPTAVLHELSPDRVINPATGLLEPPASTRVEKPMVFFVGDLIGDSTPVPDANSAAASVFRGMTMKEILTTVAQVCTDAEVHPKLSAHPQAQLLVARGTEDDLQFVRAALAALRDKARLDVTRQAEGRLRLPPGKGRPDARFEADGQQPAPMKAAAETKAKTNGTNAP